MKTHKNARDILPDSLLRELQRYVSGETLYIPKAEEKKPWGSRSGARSYYSERNAAIREQYAAGTSLGDLCEQYCLSPETVRKILYSEKK